MSRPYQALSDALGARRDEVLLRWLQLYRLSRLRLPGVMDDDELSRWFAPLLESFTDAFAPVPRPDGRIGSPVGALVPGADDLRDVEKAAAFLGGRLAAESVSGFDVAAVFTAFREAILPLCAAEVRNEASTFLEWLTVMAVDAMASAREQALRERTREELERGTPVVLVAPDVVAIFLIGAPDALALDTIIGRAMLRIARVGARAVVVDLGGVTVQGNRGLADALGRFLSHRKIADSIPVFLAGLESEVRPLWQDVVASSGGDLVTLVPSFEMALESALEHSEYRLVRRR